MSLETDEPNEEFEDRLDRVEDLLAEGELAAARQAWERLEREYPADPSVALLEAWLLEAEGFPEEALVVVELLIRSDPFDIEAHLSRCQLLRELRRFEEALSELDALRSSIEGEEDPAAQAWYHQERGLALDQLGKPGPADREFKRASRLDPDTYPLPPPRLAATDFDAIVRTALDAVPGAFDQYLSQVIVQVRDYPTTDDPTPSLLGLYVGEPRTERGHDQRDHLDYIYIFKRNLEIAFPDPDELREEIRKTVIHELAHHFGLDEEDMGEYR